ncbi:MAG: glycerate kinase [Bacillota bacterium]
MKFIFAPDSFKGTLSSAEVIEILSTAASHHFPDAGIVKIPVADGGEGTVEALVAAAGGEYRTAEVAGPLGEKVKARYGVIRGDIAVIEMAQASGLTLAPQEKRNPLSATTYGTGELIRAALDEGLKDFIIGIGGSATNDGGTGASQALGVRFFDGEKKSTGFGGRELAKIRRIDLSGMDPRIKECRMTVICDVTNPLTGEKGATRVYGPQKGATVEMLEELEQGMQNFAGLIRAQTGLDPDGIPGAGAAGGLGAALVCFFKAILKPGIDTVLDLVNFDRLLSGADLVVTGEGRIDGQSVYGKVPVGVARRCKGRGIPVIAVTGGMDEGAYLVYEQGIDAIIPTVNRSMSLEEAMARSRQLMEDAGDRLFRMIKAGIRIGGKQDRI